MSKLIDNYEKMYNKEMVSVIHTAFEDVPRVVAMVWVNSKNSIRFFFSSFLLCDQSALNFTLSFSI